MTIQAEGTFTARDIAQGNWTHSRRISALLLLASLLAFAGGMFLSIKNGGRWRDQVVLLASGLFLLAYSWAYSWPVLLYRARHRIARRPNVQGIFRYEFGDDGWSLAVPNAMSEIKWTGVSKWVEGSHSFVIYVDANSGTVIPKRFFQSPADVDAVRVLLQTKVRKK
jgi:hypothetical protein